MFDIQSVISLHFVLFILFDVIIKKFKKKKLSKEFRTEMTDPLVSLPHTEKAICKKRVTKPRQIILVSPTFYFSQNDPVCLS